MKLSNKILWAISFVIIFVGCSKSTTDLGDNDISVDLNKRYIQFDSGIQTRGALKTDLFLEESFAVLGYQHRGRWEAASVMATPNVFESTPQIVTYLNGIYQYSPVKVWTGNNYSFFGYYPHNNSNIVLFEGEVIDNKGNIKAIEGVPYITYTQPTDGDPTKLVDIMTANYIDTHVDVSPEVRLEMHHRLSAMDIMARNYYKHIDEITGDTHLVTIEIIDLKLSLKTFTGAKIYLDGSPTIPSEYVGEGENRKPQTTTVAYQIVGGNSLAWAPSTFDVKPNKSDDTGLRAITSEQSTSILLIPQDDDIEGSLQMKYKKKINTSEYLKNEANLKDDNVDNDYIFESETALSTFERSLVEGRRYFIEITFTSDAVSVNITAADEWDKIDDKDLEQEFE